MALVDTAGNADDGAAGVLIPVRGSETGEGGNDIAAVGVGNLGGHIFGVGGGIDKAHLIAQPLNGRPGHEDGALQGIGDLAVDAPGDGGDETVLREHGSLSGVHEHETARAVGVLGFAGLKAGLAEERGLLIAGGTGDGNGSAEEGGIGIAVDAA